MKTLAVRQPWATLIAEGSKTIEVRTWRTSHRGPLLIAASGKPLRLENDHGQIETLPAGCLVCTVQLVDVRPLTAADFSAACLDWRPGDEAGHFAWLIAAPMHVRPFSHRGRLSIYETPDDHIEELPDEAHYLDHPSGMWPPF